MKYSITQLKNYTTLYYPFTINEISQFKDYLNFNSLSKNTSIDWNFDLIKSFEGKWNWGELENNLSVYSKVTLGLLFPERVDVRSCDCEEQLDFCECVKARPRMVEWERSYLSPKHKKDYLDEYAVEVYFKNSIKPEDVAALFLKNEF